MQGRVSRDALEKLQTSTVEQNDTNDDSGRSSGDQ